MTAEEAARIMMSGGGAAKHEPHPPIIIPKDVSSYSDTAPEGGPYWDSISVTVERDQHTHGTLTVSSNGTYTHPEPGAWNVVIVKTKTTTPSEAQFLVNHWPEYVDPDNPDADTNVIVIDDKPCYPAYDLTGMKISGGNGGYTVVSDGTSAFLVEFRAEVTNEPAGRVLYYRSVTNLSTGQRWQASGYPYSVTYSGRISTVQLEGAPEIEGAVIKMPFSVTYEKSGSKSENKMSYSVSSVGGSASDLENAMPFITTNL